MLKLASRCAESTSLWMGNVASPKPRWTTLLPLFNRSCTRSLISSVAERCKPRAVSVNLPFASLAMEPIVQRLGCTEAYPIVMKEEERFFRVSM